jgi:hypothetical protein
MKRLISRAEKKAIRVLKKELLRRMDGCINISDHRYERYLKYFYMKEFWKFYFPIATEHFKPEGCDCTCIEEVFSFFEQALIKDSYAMPYISSPSADGRLLSGHDSCISTDDRLFRGRDLSVRNLPGWVEVKLPDKTFRIIEADRVFYIVASSMDGFPIEIPLARLLDTILAFDLYTQETDLGAILNKTMLEVSADEKAKQILTMTARTLIEDVLKGEHVRFEVTQQKNGRLCCKILRFASWFPNKIFRTSFETFREDFIKAYDEFRKQNSTRYYL